MTMRALYVTPALSRQSRWAAGLALACAAVLLAPGQPVWAADKPTTHTVVMKAVSYEPAALTVKRGDTVMLVNKDPYPHPVTSAGHFDSKSIAPGASWKYKANKVGDFAYTCTFHPNMNGTLHVE